MAKSQKDLYILDNLSETFQVSKVVTKKGQAAQAKPQKSHKCQSFAQRAKSGKMSKSGTTNEIG